MASTPRREGRETDAQTRSTGFTSEDLDRTVIAIPLLQKIEREPGPFHVIIDLNLDFHGGHDEAPAPAGADPALSDAVLPRAPGTRPTRLA